MRDQIVKLAGAPNFRDLGGLATTDGQVTRSGRMFRSDTLDYLTKGDVDTLTGALGLRTVIDLRAGEENPLSAPAWASTTSLRFVNLPLDHSIFDDEATRADRDRRTLQARRYLTYIDAWSDNVVAALRLFAASAQDGPCLVHCAQGKDRTGVVVALLLGLLDVRRDAIVADYIESAKHVEAVTARNNANEFYRARALVNPPELYRADPHTMEYFLDVLDERFGGPADWALRHGLGAEEISVLRTQLRQAENLEAGLAHAVRSAQNGGQR